MVLRFQNSELFMEGLDKLTIESKPSIWVGFGASDLYSECARCESSPDIYILAEISRDIPQALGQVTDCYLNIDALTFSFHIIFN
jgi:hypothetical protein